MLRLISGTNFLFHFVNQFQLTLYAYLSSQPILLFSTFSIRHTFTLSHSLEDKNTGDDEDELSHSK